MASKVKAGTGRTGTDGMNASVPMRRNPRHGRSRLILYPKAALAGGQRQCIGPSASSGAENRIHYSARCAGLQDIADALNGVEPVTPCADSEHPRALRSQSPP